MLRVQLVCERRFKIEFYGADSHFCHAAYVTWFHAELCSTHVRARLSHFCCHTHFVRSDLRVECSSEIVISKMFAAKHTVYVAVTLKPVRLECYLPPLSGAKSSHEITWHDDMGVYHLTTREFTSRENSVSPALDTNVNYANSTTDTKNKYRLFQT